MFEVKSNDDPREDNGVEEPSASAEPAESPTAAVEPGEDPKGATPSGEREDPPVEGDFETEGDREPDPVSALEARIGKLEGELAESRDRMLRALADADNVRKRSTHEREELRKYGAQALARSLLDVTDSFERALSSIPEDTDGAAGALREGVSLTLQEWMSVLRRHHVTRLDPPAGERFDPGFHQAVQQVERDDLPSGSVAQVLQSGYVLHDRLLRAASVLVATAPKAPPEGEETPPDVPDNEP